MRMVWRTSNQFLISEILTLGHNLTPWKLVRAYCAVAVTSTTFAHGVERVSSILDFRDVDSRS